MVPLHRDELRPFYAGPKAVSSDKVFSTRTGAVLTIVISQPERRNALSLGVVAKLTRAFEEATRDSEVRCIVLTGAGDRVFAAGADITELKEAMATPASARLYDATVTALYDAMASCEVPIVARLNGHAIGGGMLLALACDIRVAACGAKVGLPAGRIGLMLSPREYELVRHSMHASHAKWLLYTGRILSVEQGLTWGLIDEICELQELDETVTALATEIAQLAPRSVTASKRLLKLAAANDLDSGRTISEAYESVYRSEDLREGISSFLEKRQPIFTGK